MNGPMVPAARRLTPPPRPTGPFDFGPLPQPQNLILLSHPPSLPPPRSKKSFFSPSQVPRASFRWPLPPSFIPPNFGGATFLVLSLSPPSQLPSSSSPPRLETLCPFLSKCCGGPLSCAKSLPLAACLSPTRERPFGGLQRGPKHQYNSLFLPPLRVKRSVPPN